MPCIVATLEIEDENVGTLITLFRPIIMSCGIDIVLRNILHVHIECGNIMYNNVSPTKHCYGLE